MAFEDVLERAKKRKNNETQQKEQKWNDVLNRAQTRSAQDVDDKYIQSYLTDSQSYFSQAKTDLDGLSWESATDTDRINSRKKTGTDLLNRSNKIRAYLNVHKDSMDEDTYNSWMAQLDSDKKSYSSIAGYFDSAYDNYSQYEGQQHYDIYHMSLDEIQAKIDSSADAPSQADVQAAENRSKTVNGRSRNPQASSKRTASEGRSRDYQVETQQKPDSKIAYTTKSGQNITWQDIYDQKLDAQTFNADYTEYSSRANWDEFSQELSNPYLLDSDWQLMNSIRSSSVPYRWEDAKEQGYTESQWKKAKDKRDYIAEKYNLDLSTKEKATTVLQEKMDALYSKEGELANFDHIDMLTDEERGVLYYIANVQGRKAALNWFNKRKHIYDERARTDMAQRYQGIGEEHPLFGSVLSVGTNLAAGGETLVDGISYLFTGEMDHNESAVITNSLRSGAMQAVDWEIGNWDAYDFLYGTGMSMADSVVSRAFGPTGGAISQGLGAAGHATNDALDRGMSSKQAFWTGVAAGTAEAVFEKYSISKFDALKEVPAYTVKDIAKNIGKSMLTNASEEALTEIANITYDVLINGEFSQWDTAYRQYLANGYSHEEALGKTFGDNFWQVVEAGASGALMGFGFGAAGSAGSVVDSARANRQYNRQTRAIAEQTAGNEANVKAMLGTANDLLEGSTGRLKSRLEKRIGKVQDNATAKNAQKLYKTMDAAAKAQNRADIVKSLKSKGISNTQAGRIADAIIAMSERNAITENDLGIISNEVIDVVYGGDLSKRDRSDLEAKGVPGAIEAVINEFINNDGSTVNQRSRKLGTLQRSIVANHLVQEGVEQATAEKLADIVVAAENGQKLPVAAQEVLDSLQQNSKLSEAIRRAKDAVNLTAEEAFANLEKDYSGSNSVIANMPQEQKNAFLHLFDENKNTSGGEFAHAMAAAYSLGYKNRDVSNLDNLVDGHLLKTLTKEQIMFAWEEGRTAAELEERKAKGNKNTATNKKAAARKGGVYYGYEGQTIDQRKVDDEHKKLTKAQRVGIDFVKRLSKRFGMSFYFYESYLDDSGNRVYKDKNGKIVDADNGYYDPKDGSIHIDLNSGEFGRKTVLFTIAHELTHFIKDQSPHQFNKMAYIVMKHYNKAGIPVDELVKQQQEDAKNREEELSYDEAYEEVIASSLEGVLSDGKVMEFLGKLEAKDKSLGAKVRKFFQNVAGLIKQTINAYRGLSPDSTEGQLIMQMEGILEELQPVFAEGLYEAGLEIKTNNRVAQDKEIAYSKRGKPKVFFKENVFPPYNESHSDAHEWAERWARSEDAEICDRRLASYHNTWYLIEAFDDMKYGYQIIKKLTAKEYTREAKNYGTIAGYKSIQDTSSENASLLRRRDTNGDAGHRADNDTSEHRGENSTVYGVGTDQNGRKPVKSNGGGNQGSSGSDTRGKEGPSVSADTTKESARKRVTDREVMRIAEQDGITEGLNKGQIESLAVFNRKVAELNENKKQLAEQKKILSDLEAAEKAKTPEAVKARNRIKTLETMIARQNEEIAKYEAYDSIKSILSVVRPQVESKLLEERKKALAKYSTIPQGENAVRESNLPATTDGKNKVSRTARTVYEAGVTPDDFADLIDKEVYLKDGLSYVPVSNNETTQKAIDYITEEGWEAARGSWSAQVRSGKVSAELSAMGALLLNNAARAGDKKTWLDVLHDYQIMSTNAGQAVQALRILKTLSPDDSLYMIKRSVNQMVKDMGLQDITIDPELEQAYLGAKSDKAREKARKNITKHIALQIPSTFMDRWTALRYVNMLGNLRTQIRNLTGNIGMTLVSEMKNAVATAIENIAALVTNGTYQKTKSVFVSKDLLKASRADFNNVKAIILNGGKYADSTAERNAFENEILDQRRIFKFKLLEGYRKLTNLAMEGGDLVFSKHAYAMALARYLKAHGIKNSDFSKIDTAIMDEARLYAVKEAQETTFRDTNALSGWISKIGRRKDTPKAAKAISEGIMPFRKTPANILIRAEEYSPLGIVNSLIISTMAVAGKGEVTGTQVVNSWAKTLTGTGLFLLGMMLQDMGLLTGGPDDNEEEDEFDSMYGWQNYAITLPDGTNLTIDFLSPAAMTLFMGAQFNKMRQDGGIELKEVDGAFYSLADPMIEMSMLQGVNDTLENIQYSEYNTGQFVINAAMSYLTQGLTNSMLGQMERSFEDSRMTTYVDKNSPLPDWLQRQLGKMSAKAPGWDYNQVPYIDAWGEEQENPGLLANAAYNMLSPSYVSKGKEDAVYDELMRLDEVQSDVNVFPNTPSKEYEDRYLTAEEYVALAKSQGKMQRRLVEELISSDLYIELPDEYKAKAIEYAYSYARESAQIEVLGRKGYSADWMGAIKGNEAEGILGHIMEENVKGMFLAGDISAEEAVERRIEYCGDSREEAEEKIAYWNFQESYPSYSWSQSAVVKYYDYAKPANINMDIYNSFCNQTSGLKKKDDILKVIDSLNISSSQKDALYRMKGYADSTLDEAPWH